MKKKFMLLASIVAFSITAFANNDLGLNIYMGGGLSFKENDRNYKNIISDGGIDDSKLKKRPETVRAYTFNLDITKNINDYVELGVGVGYVDNFQYTYDFKYKNNGEKDAHAKVFSINNVPVYATAKLNFAKGKIKPYVKADLGYAFNTKFRYFKYSNPNLDATGDKHQNNKIEDHGGVYVGASAGLELYNFFVEGYAHHIVNDVVVNWSEDGYTRYLTEKEKETANDKYEKFKNNTIMGVKVGYKFQI